MRPPVSVMTIGGFLGAGKTTLVNQLLSRANGRRYVVFVNDFGDINIDYDLIDTAEADRISLKNGCVCCTLNNDLIEKIATFCKQQTPDAILIETSGVADPRALDHSLFPLVQAGYINLDYKMYILDADQIGHFGYADAETLIDQAQASDLVILNKCDLVDAHSLAEIRKLLTRSGAAAAIIETTFARLPFDALLLSPKHPHDPPAPDIDFTHDGFESWSCENFAPLDFDAFDAFLKSASRFVLRAKGRVFFENEPRQLVGVDMVGQRRVFRKATSNIGSALIAIGRQECFQREAFEEFFSPFRQSALYNSPLLTRPSLQTPHPCPQKR